MTEATHDAADEGATPEDQPPAKPADNGATPGDQPLAKPVDRSDNAPVKPREIGGRKGPDPVRYGDWEKNGRCIDF